MSVLYSEELLCLFFQGNFFLKITNLAVILDFWVRRQGKIDGKYTDWVKNGHFLSDDRSFDIDSWNLAPDRPKESESEIKNYDFWKWLFKNGQLKFGNRKQMGRPRKKYIINSF